MHLQILRIIHSRDIPEITLCPSGFKAGGYATKIVKNKSHDGLMILSYALFENHSNKTPSKPRTLFETILSLLCGGYIFSNDPVTDIEDVTERKPRNNCSRFYMKHSRREVFFSS